MGSAIVIVASAIEGAVLAGVGIAIEALWITSSVSDRGINLSGAWDIPSKRSELCGA